MNKIEKARLADGYSLEVMQLFQIPQDWSGIAGIGDHVYGLFDAERKCVARGVLDGAGKPPKLQAWERGKVELVEHLAIPFDKLEWS